jgi:hypothetical protein
MSYFTARSLGEIHRAFADSPAQAKAELEQHAAKLVLATARRFGQQAGQRAAQTLHKEIADIARRHRGASTVTRSLSGQAGADRAPFEWLPPGKGDHGSTGYGVYNRNGDLLQVVKTPVEASRICRTAQGGFR